MCVNVLTVQKVEEYMESIAPKETAEAFDNVGLILGNPEAIVDKILVTLDVTMQAVQEAKEIGAQLIISHHPLLFHARKRLVENDPEACILCELIRNHMSVISYHTNLDLSKYSGSACTARALGLQNICNDGFVYYGDIDGGTSLKEIVKRIETALGTSVRVYGSTESEIRRLAISGGAYDEGYEKAMELGAQVYLTGEVRHHNAIAAAMQGMVLIDGTHWATEEILVSYLASSLQKAFSELQYSVTVYPSSAALFAGGKD